MLAAIPLSPEQQDEAYLPLLPAIEDQLHEGYSEKLLFHVWPHATAVRDQNLANRSALIAEGVRKVPGIFVTSVAADGHDYGMYDFFKGDEATEFKYPEALAINQTAAVLRERHVDEATITEISNYIDGTRAGVRCRTLGTYGLCAADLGNTTEDYDSIVLPNLDLLRQEYALLKGVDLGHDGYVDFSVKLLAKYFMVNLNWPFILSQSHLFRELRSRQQANLTHLVSDRAIEFIDRARSIDTAMLKYARTLGQPIVQFVKQAVQITNTKDPTAS